MAVPVNAYQVRVGYSLNGFVGFDAPGVVGARFEGRGLNQVWYIPLTFGVQL